MNVTNNPATYVGLTPTDLHKTLQELRETATKDLSQALTDLGVINATGGTGGNEGIIQLAAPKLMMSAMDLTLRIGLLQDALNQLQEQTSRTEIEGRLGELNRDNKDKLTQIKENMDHVAEQAKKNKEAQKKTDIFTAIANFFKAIFDAIAAVFTLIAAVGYALTGNAAAAAALVVAATALIASSVVNFTMAIDSVMKAVGGQGFLSDADIQRMQKAVEILGYIAMGASMVAGLGAIVEGISTASKMAASKLGDLGFKNAGELAKQMVKEVATDAFTESAYLTTKSSDAAKLAMEKAVEEAMKEGASKLIKEVAVDTIKAAVKESLMNSLLEFMQMGTRTAIAAAATQGAGQILTGVGETIVADIKADAANEKRLADEAEAKLKAIEAMMQMLRQMIEELQKQLGEMLDSAMEAVSAIFNAVDETSSSMKELMHFQAA